MALKLTINFKTRTQQLQEGVGKFVDRAVQKSVKVMERNVKINTPVKHGHLRRSIHSRSTGFGKGEVYNEAVEGGKEITYAIYQEYGTRHIAPRAMFRKGAGQSQKEIQSIFAEEARKVRNDAAGGVK